jgi:uncharacterized protein (TIGR02453 family)
MTEQVFDGFPKQGLQFLADLADNNNREWFTENKQTYLDYVVSPAQAFIETVGDQLKFISPHIQYDTRTNGQGSLMRIYRDIRFSPDKTPYKTYVGIRFWEGAGKAKDNPGYFLWFDNSGAGLHGGMHGFDKPMLSAYREAVADDRLGPDLERVVESLAAMSDYEVGGEHYKRVPRGFDTDHPRADLLRHNSLYVSSPRIEPAVLSSPKLTAVALDHCEKMAPLQRWLVTVREGMGG